MVSCSLSFSFENLPGIFFSPSELNLKFLIEGSSLGVVLYLSSTGWRSITLLFDFLYCLVGVSLTSLLLSWKDSSSGGSVIYRGFGSSFGSSITRFTTLSPLVPSSFALGTILLLNTTGFGGYSTTRLLITTGLGCSGSSTTRLLIAAGFGCYGSSSIVLLTTILLGYSSALY